MTTLVVGILLAFCLVTGALTGLGLGLSVGSRNSRSRH